MGQVTRKMPKYQCYKQVWALKIKKILQDEANRWNIVPTDDGYDSFVVSEEFMQKHKPEAGGYYVVYSDGYESFSPADTFESGYSLI